MSQPAYLFVGGPLDGNWEAVPGEPRVFDWIVEERDEPLDPMPRGVKRAMYRRFRVRDASWAFYVYHDMSIEDVLAALVAWYKKEPKRAAKR